MSSASIILEMISGLSANAKEMVRTITPLLESATLTIPDAELALATCVSFLASVDTLYDAIETASEAGDIDDDAEETASDAADSLHDFGIELQNSMFERLARMSGNAGSTLATLQDKYYSD